MAKVDNTKLFKTRVRQFIRYFNLINYHVVLSPCPSSDTDYYACVECDEVQGEESPRTVRILYNATLLNCLEPWRVEQIAFHEAVELLLSNLALWAACRKFRIGQREIDGEAHSIIHVLENTVFMQALKDAKQIKGEWHD